MPALKEESVPDWITDAGSAFHIRTVAGKKEYLYFNRRLSGHTALDTSGHDLMYQVPYAFDALVICSYNSHKTNVNNHTSNISARNCDK